MAFLLIFLLCLPLQHAPSPDRVTLPDGTVLSGRVEAEEKDYLLFRVVKEDGKISYLQRIPRRQVISLDRGAVKQPLQPSEALDADIDGISGPEIGNKVVFLNATIDEWKIRNVESASRRLVRLINQSSVDELLSLNEVTRNRLDATMPEFAAEVHLAYAMMRARDGHFRLYFVMPFHVKELYQGLKVQSQRAMVQAVFVQDDSGRVDGQVRSDAVVEWLGRQDEYDGDAGQALRFSKQVTKVMGMNRELTRLSRILNEEPETIREMDQQYAELRKLLAAVNRQKGRI